jgi:hypothetical protein
LYLFTSLVIPLHPDVWLPLVAIDQRSTKWKEEVYPVALDEGPQDAG